MNTSLSIYTAYFLVSLGMTIWVAHTLHKNGRLFLIEAFAGNQEMADSVNHLFLVGFYLMIRPLNLDSLGVMRTATNIRYVAEPKHIREV